MASLDSRYNVTITLDIRDATTGELMPFSRTIHEYFDMKYEDMQETQMTSISALLAALGQYGNDMAAEFKEKRGAKK